MAINEGLNRIYFLNGSKKNARDPKWQPRLFNPTNIWLQVVYKFKIIISSVNGKYEHHPKKSHKFVYGLIWPILLSITNFLLWLTKKFTVCKFSADYIHAPTLQHLPSSSQLKGALLNPWDHTYWVSLSGRSLVYSVWTLNPYSLLKMLTSPFRWVK